MGSIKEWLPTIVACGALGVVWILIRRMVADLKNDLISRLTTMQSEINSIKDTYMEEEKHALICGKSALEIEKLFTKCLNATKDAIFAKLREIEKNLTIKSP